jgi:sugar O-acyltransferase (sialic acid O-acetyltransferase NeuD family)
MTEKVVVFGNTDLAVLDHFYLTYDSPHDVVAFTVDAAYMRDTSFCGLPMMPFEHLEERFPPEDYALSILLGFRDVNRLRAGKYAKAKAKGYRCISYVSSSVKVWPGVAIGESCHIYENVVVQPFTTIGDNVVIAPGCMIGHHSRIEDHCFIAAHANVLGEVRIGSHSVLGANCTITDGLAIGRECIIGAGALITKSTNDAGIYPGKSAERLPKSSREMGGLLTWSRASQRDRD